MATKELKTRILLLKNTQAYFYAKNPTTLNGEIYIVEDSEKIRFKVGNGQAYNDIPFYDENLLELLGFDIKDVVSGQILIYNGTTQKWENVNLADNNSIIYLTDSGLSIKGYSSANQGLMLVKDATLGLTWVDPVSTLALELAVAAATAKAQEAGNYATQAGNQAVRAETAASNAERINELTMAWVSNKFWWGTLEEYNALEKIDAGTFYYILEM